MGGRGWSKVVEGGRRPRLLESYQRCDGREVTDQLLVEARGRLERASFDEHTRATQQQLCAQSHQRLGLLDSRVILDQLLVPAIESIPSEEQMLVRRRRHLLWHDVLLRERRAHGREVARGERHVVAHAFLCKRREAPANVHPQV